MGCCGVTKKATKRISVNDGGGDDRDLHRVARRRRQMCISDGPEVQADFKINVYGMIWELRYCRGYAVICGPSAAFWGCEDREAVIMDEAIGWVHWACGESQVPCFHGGPFWEDLIPLRKVSDRKKMKLDKWHHSDKGSGRMAYILIGISPTWFACCIRSSWTTSFSSLLMF